MNITYIFHSGFAVEGEHSIAVFDYWLDPANVMPNMLGKGKHVYVFSSHFHEDHYTSAILQWKEQYPTTPITYILSRDILKRHRANWNDADVWMAKGAQWSDNHIKVRATGSNDSGVSWIVEMEGKRIFHAGDLNNWYARFLTDDFQGGTIFSQEFGEIDPLADEKRYLGELKDILKISDRFDIVMFPIDGRIGNGYTRGGRQFIDRFSVGLFVPMHFVVSGFESAWRMKEFTDEKHIPFWSITHEGATTRV